MALLQPVPSAPTDSAPAGQERVRPTHARLQYALHQGVHRSATLRRLLRELESSALIVYVTAGGCLQPDAPGCLVFQGAQNAQRYIRIRINPEQPTDRLIITLAHEFQHALEVARAPDLVDESGLRSHFQRIGKATASTSWVYETRAAVDAGGAARAELAAARRVHRPAAAAALPGCETIERFCLCDRSH